MTRALHTRTIGARGENIATEYLLRHGYRILSRNYRARWVELDIVCEVSGVVVCIEVKTRCITSGYGYNAIHNHNMTYHPCDAIYHRKVNALRRGIRYYVLHKSQFGNAQVRIDVIGVILTPEGSLLQLQHFKNVGF